MSRVVALLRGVNVGAHHRVPMPRLREALTQDAFEDVVTVLASGNVIATAPAGLEPGDVGERIRRIVLGEFGVDAPVEVRTAAELRRVVELDPLAQVAADGSRYLVTFVTTPPDAGDVAWLLARAKGEEACRVVGREVYVWCPEGVRATALTAAAMEGRWGGVATARNWNTLSKIVARL